MNLGLLLKQLMGPQQQGFSPQSGNLMDAMQQTQQPDPMQTAAMPEQSAFRGGLADLLDSRVAMPMAAGLLAGGTPAESFSNAFAAGGSALGKLKDDRRANDYFSKTSPDLAQMVNAGLPVDAAWSAALKKKNATSDVTYGMTPQWGLDDQGKPVMGVVGNDGTFKKIDTPGFNISKTPIKMDAGTHWVLLDPVTRQPIAEIPKDLAGAAAATATGAGAGKEKADAIASYNSMSSKMPGLETVVKKLDDLSEKATYTAAGQGLDWTRTQLGMDPREAAVAATDYTATVANQILPLLRDTFGAQFTQVEGERLMATMGDINKTPKEKQAVLKAFIEQKRRDVEAMARQAGSAGVDPNAGGAPDQGGGGEETWVRGPDGKLVRQ